MAINTISYDNKSDINTSTTPIQNKITASNMNEIKSIVNSNANLMGDLANLTTTEKSSLVGALNESKATATTQVSFDTTEQEIGTYLGVKFYRKVYDVGSLPNNTSKDTITDLPTSYKIVNVYGNATSSNAVLPIPATNPASNAYSIAVTMLQEGGYWKIVMSTGIDRSAFTGYVVLEYTK